MGSWCTKQADSGQAQTVTVAEISGDTALQTSDGIIIARLPTPKERRSVQHELGSSSPNNVTIPPMLRKLSTEELAQEDSACAPIEAMRSNIDLLSPPLTGETTNPLKSPCQNRANDSSTRTSRTSTSLEEEEDEESTTEDPNEDIQQASTTPLDFFCVLTHEQVRRVSFGPELQTEEATSGLCSPTSTSSRRSPPSV